MVVYILGKLYLGKGYFFSEPPKDVNTEEELEKQEQERKEERKEYILNC